MQKSKKIWSRCIECLALIICAILGFGTVSYAADTYSYDIWGNVVAAPVAYELERTVYVSSLGVDSMTSAQSVFYRNGKIYIPMRGRIVIADKEFEDVTTITEYKREDGTVSSIQAPTGIFVTEDDHIYICERDQGEIVEFDENLNCVRVVGDPNCIGLTVTYRPEKIVVDSVGRIYVKVQNCYEGFVELNPEGEFNRYVGATKVTYSLWQLMWRQFSTEEQRARSALWLPTSYSDLAIDQDGFIYASISDIDNETPVRKLNSSGEDVMPEHDFVTAPKGDYDSSKASLSSLTSIAVADDGRFAVMDANYARIFVYSNDGYLLYCFGGKGNVGGTLSAPTAFCFMDNKIVVVDSVTQSLEVFAPTTYGTYINSALEAQSKYDYETAAGYWEQVLDINNNFYYASLGMGKYQMRTGEYDKAMNNFYLGADRTYYSNAYARVSGEWMDSHFSMIITIVVLVIVLFIAWKVYRKFRPAQKKDTKLARAWEKTKFTLFKWPLYAMSSPFKAFDDVKYYDDGNLIFSIVVIILYGWISLIKYRYTGFLVSFVDIDNVNVPMIVGSAMLPFIAFIFGNWAVGVLLSGKGKVVHITKVVGYALYPGLYLNLAGTILSNYVTQDEAALVNALFVLAWVLFFFYLFIGTIMVNQYTFTKNVASLILSVVAMLIICFVAMLFATLLGQFVNDWIQIVREFMLL